MRGTVKGCIVNVIVVIDGREAIPVRAIPLLTDWETMGPDAVAQAFTWDEHIYKSEGFHAYQIENGTAKPIGARWWKNVVCVQLDALHHELKRQEASGILSEQEGRRQWRIGSLPLLPAGVFVWKDEFEPLHAIKYGIDGSTELSDKTADGAMPEDEQLRTVKLDYDPFIAELKTQRLAMEGFMPPERAPDHNSPKTNVPPATDTAPEQNTATPAPVVTAKRSEKKPSIETAALDYMRAEFKQGQFQSAAKFHKHLIKTAGLDKSPFEMGTGINARKLFCPAASSFFDEGTLSKIWAKIRAA